MEFTREDRRTLIALACQMAWADGVVTIEEREFVHGMLGRFADGAVTPDELEAWLDGGTPAVKVRSLGKGLGELFTYEAMRLMEVDGDIADSELALLEDMTKRLFRDHPDATPIARIILAKRAAQ